MAMNMLPLRPSAAAVRASSGGRKRDASGRKKLWTPLFGFSGEPDYVESKTELDPKPPERSRLNPGGFTEEKARQLRRLTTDTSSFHTDMYHSAIASRLASDFSDHGTDPQS